MTVYLIILSAFCAGAFVGWCLCASLTMRKIQQLDMENWSLTQEIMTMKNAKIAADWSIVDTYCNPKSEL